MPKDIDPEDRADYRTGPNVDAGLVPGAVTVDPNTAAGLAAAAARDANGATTELTDDGVEIVTPKDPTYEGDDPKVAAGTGQSDPDAPAVDKVSAAAKKKDPTTIANEPDDIKADPKADVQ